MSVVIDISDVPLDRISFAVSPLAELGAVLHVLAESAHHPGLHEWATETMASLSPDLADRLHEADLLWRSTRSDLFLPGSGAASLGEELDALDRLDDDYFVAAAVEISCTTSFARPGPSPLHDPEDRRRALELAAARGPRQAAFADRLLEDPQAVRAWLRSLLAQCEQAFFGDVWQRVRNQLVADARHKTQILRHQGLERALAAVSPAISLDAARSRIVIDKLQDGRLTGTAAGLVFLPTAFGWPHLVIRDAHGDRTVIQYPAALPDVPPSLPLETVQRRLEAVAHPVRLRLCRTLARGAHSTKELADAYRLTPPEVSRHLAVLKKAGLIKTRREGRYVLHELDLQLISRLGPDLLGNALR
ncbi:ArsR family transcriptional regulator [Streptomyces sp. NRRL B-1568]|nr:ArsR family transcriptional regulator [Streptomyces sp. NRRL B-1568]